MNTNKVASLARSSPVMFVVGLFLVESAVAVPFVVAFRVAGLDMEPLRLIIPTAQSIFMLGVIWVMGWFRETGFSTTARELHTYGVPLAIAFVPVFVYGTVSIPAGPLAFYTLAVLVTGISEEALGRGVALHTLLPKGKAVALGVSAGLFSASHFSNLVFSDGNALDMASVLLETFSFGILYGAVMLRTGNIIPLMIIHALADYLYITSGSAGPFLATPMNDGITLVMATINILCGIFLVRSVRPGPFEGRPIVT